MRETGSPQGFVIFSIFNHNQPVAVLVERMQSESFAPADSMRIRSYFEGENALPARKVYRRRLFRCGFAARGIGGDGRPSLGSGVGSPRD
jgi:hypothetical protein